jgi:hypothetical protein
MVKKLLIFLGYTLFFMAALIYFTPKISIYYFLEKELKAEGVIISAEEVEDSGFSLLLSHAELSYRGIDSAKIERVHVNIFELYNSVNVQGVVLSSAAENFLPLKINSIDITYTLLNPLNVVGSAEGEFGFLNVEYSILENSVHLELEPSKLMLKNYKSTLENLVKSEDGGYLYEKTF